jgi:hypothetical protein
MMLVPLTFVIGAGGSFNVPRYNHGSLQPLSPAIDGFVGARVSDSVALGAHGRVTPLSWRYVDNIPIVETTKDMLMFDVGAALQVARGRWFFEGWLGAHITRSSSKTQRWPIEDTFGSGPPESTSYARDAWVLGAGGVVVGVDLTDHTYRPSLYLQLQTSSSDRDKAPHIYTALTLGVALRY